MPVNLLQPDDPYSTSSNPLARAPTPTYDPATAVQPDTGTPTMGQAVTSGVDALGQWLAAQRAKSVQMGLMDANTGMPTRAGAVDAAQQYGNALLMGTTAPGIRAYHGSPHSFEAFDTSKIGTGEGAQAYGHGLYFAEGEGVARSYREGLSPRSTPDLSSYDIPKDTAERVANGWFDYLKNAAPADHAAMAEYLRKQGAPVDMLGADILEGKLKPNQGHMYEVNIGAEPEHFLHWDKPLSEQSPQVQQAFKRLGYEGGTDAAGNPMSGGDIYRSFGDPANAAQFLQQAGIPGIRYLDQGSRGAGQGTHNLVVFDANTIDILRKYGIAGLIAGGGAAAAGTQQQQPSQ